MTNQIISWRANVPVAEESIPALDELLTSVGAGIVTGKVDDAWVLTAYFEAEHFNEDAVHKVLDNAFNVMQFRPSIYDIAPVYQEDVMEKMKQSFPPLEVASFFIHSFDETVPEGMVDLQVSVNVAFGTGEHPTTAACLTLYDDLSEQKQFKNGLDMGCGSAILAMAAAKRDHVPFVAVDIDKPSVEVATDNCALNKVNQLVTCMHGDGFATALVQERAPFDLVFANILANPLIDMASAMAGVMADDGVAILSGFLSKNKDAVITAYEKEGFTLLEDIAIDDWVAVAMVKAV